MGASLGTNLPMLGASERRYSKRQQLVFFTKTSKETWKRTEQGKPVSQYPKKEVAREPIENPA